MKKVPLFFLLLLLFLYAPEGQSADAPWFATAYYGIHSTENLGDTMAFKRIDTNRFAGLGLGRDILSGKLFSLEAEAMFLEHYGGNGRYAEFVLALGLRYHYFPWDRYVKTTLAVFDGPSYATRQIRDENQYWLNFIGFELTLGCPQWDYLTLVGRIHHRSGGDNYVHNGARGDSNFYTLGLRYRF